MIAMRAPRGTLWGWNCCILTVVVDMIEWPISRPLSLCAPLSPSVYLETLTLGTQPPCCKEAHTIWCLGPSQQPLLDPEMTSVVSKTRE